MSPQSTHDPRQADATSTDGPASDWHPARICDRKLEDLSRRLVKVQRLGGAFAHVRFSRYVTAPPATGNAMDRAAEG